jgi:hypothetical protein
MEYQIVSEAMHLTKQKSDRVLALSLLNALNYKMLI